MYIGTIFAADAITVVMWVLIGLLIVGMIVYPVFANKKRQQTVTTLMSSLKVGCVVKTVGGIIGEVTEVRTVSPVDKEIVIVTGTGDTKSTLTFDINAVYQVVSRAPGDVDVEETEQEEVTEQENTQETTEDEE